MLRVSIHAGPRRGVSRFNRIGWLDIGYEALGALANYKAVMFNANEDATPPVTLFDYPRWSASLWDLVARCIALAMSPDGPDRAEAVPPAKNVRKRIAFAESVTALVQHHPEFGTRIRELATMEIAMESSARGVYRATITEDQRKDIVTEPFFFAPQRLLPCELVLRSALFALSGSTDVMPPRPSFKMPRDAIVGSPAEILIHRIPEPTRTGFVRWLHHQRTLPIPRPGAPQGTAPENVFIEFVATVV